MSDPIYKIFLGLLLICAFCGDLNGQELRARMDALEQKDHLYEYYNPIEKELFSHGWIEQIYPYPVFRKVEVDKIKKMIILEGITSESYLRDTTGLTFCCFEMLVARVKRNGKLNNVRNFGMTLLASDSANKSGKDGYFRIGFKANEKDILIIGNPGRAGHGAVAYYVGRLLQ